MTYAQPPSHEHPAGSHLKMPPPSTSHPFAVVVSAVELLGLGLPLHHRVRSLQVGGVGHQRQRDVAVGHAVDAAMVHPQVVLDISRTLRPEQV